MDIWQAIETRRSIRRFTEKKIPFSDLQKLVYAASLAPSGGNLQPWRFLLVDNPVQCEKVFSTLAWAAYLGPAGRPKEGERPVAYTVFLHDTEIRGEIAVADHAAAVENLLLAAVSMGIGGCWIGSIEKENLAKILNLPESLHIVFVVALGYPAEDACIEPVRETIRYWRDKEGVQRVPKRNVETLTIQNSFDEKRKKKI
ncbi:MAG: nitroreductase family protein [Candidatus Ratteibacteria bacterium]